MRFLFTLAETAEDDINRINRWLVCEGYPPTFHGAKLVGPFISRAVIEVEIADLNDLYTDLYPGLPRPVSRSAYQARFPLAQPGLCYVNLERLYPYALSSLAPLFTWANAHPALVATWVLHENQWRPTSPFSGLPTHIRKAILDYQPPPTPTLAFNQILNLSQDLVLPEPTILFLFHAHQHLQSTGTLPHGTRQALNLICKKHDCSYAISSANQLLFGKDKLIPCDSSLYQNATTI